MRRNDPMQLIGVLEEMDRKERAQEKGKGGVLKGDPRQAQSYYDAIAEGHGQDIADELVKRWEGTPAPTPEGVPAYERAKGTRGLSAGHKEPLSTFLRRSYENMNRAEEEATTDYNKRMAAIEARAQQRAERRKTEAEARKEEELAGAIGEGGVLPYGYKSGRGDTKSYLTPSQIANLRQKADDAAADRLEQLRDPATGQIMDPGLGRSLNPREEDQLRAQFAQGFFQQYTRDIGAPPTTATESGSALKAKPWEEFRGGLNVRRDAQGNVTVEPRQERPTAPFKGKPKGYELEMAEAGTRGGRPEPSDMFGGGQAGEISGAGGEFPQELKKPTRKTGKTLVDFHAQVLRRNNMADKARELESLAKQKNYRNLDELYSELGILKYFMEDLYPGNLFRKHLFHENVEGYTEDVLDRYKA